MNKKCRIIDRQEYTKIIETIQYGYTFNKHHIRPNPRLATICITQANIGLRLGDILNLRLSSFVYENNRYRLEIVEQKTKKKRTFTIATEVYTFLQSYAIENGIKKESKLFPISSRAVNKQLVKVGQYLGIENLGSHSFRKYFAVSVYNENNYNVELVRTLLQHSSVAVTQHYIGVSPQLVEQALLNHVCIPNLS